MDACPGVIELHQAADGGLARVRIPGGRVSSAQWAELISVSSELGDGALDLTSRGNIQIRGIPAGQESALSARLWRAGLVPSWTHERARNIVASPFNGLDDLGEAPIDHLVAMVDEALCATPALTQLSGRFLFGIDDGRGDIVALEPDLCLVAVKPDQFRLLVDGLSWGRAMKATEAVSRMMIRAERFLRERDRSGTHAWRLRDLGPRSSQRVTFSEPAGEPSLPSIGTLGSAVVAGAPLGRLSADQARALHEVLATALIVTPDRTIVLLDCQAGPDRASARLASADLIVTADDPRRGVTSCTGRPGCARSIRDVRQDAAMTSRADMGWAALPVHWVGCERRCGSPAVPHIEVLATEIGYRVS